MASKHGFVKDTWKDKNGKSHSRTLIAIVPLKGEERTVYATWVYHDGDNHTDKIEYEWHYQVKGKQDWFDGGNGSVDYTKFSSKYYKEQAHKARFPEPATKDTLAKNAKGQKVKAGNIYNAVHNYKDNAVKIRFRARPVAKKKNTKKDKGPYFSTPSWTETTFTVSKAYPDAPGSAPNWGWVGESRTDIEVWSNVTDPKTTYVEFQLYNVTNQTSLTPVSAKKVAEVAKTKFEGLAKNTIYRVRCRAVRKDDALVSDWTDYSTEDIITATDTPTIITPLIAETSNSIRVSWTRQSSATSYTIEYTTNKDYFDQAPGQVQSDEIANGTTYLAIGLESETDHEYFFRVRANRVVSGTDGRSSNWSKIESCLIGKTPDAPTTWSSSTTCSVGDPVYLYWTHNSKDNSRETSAIIKLTINGTTLADWEVPNRTLEDEDTGTHRQLITLNDVRGVTITNDTIIKWKVQTKGVMPDYSAYSTEREIKVYTKPSLELVLGTANRWYWDDFEFTDENNVYISKGELVPLEFNTDSQLVLTNLPLFFKLSAAPKTQRPTTYNVAVYSNEDYEDVDEVTGARRFVTKGTEVFSTFIDIDPADEGNVHEVLTYAYPSKINLQNGATYRVVASVAMDSGLNAETEDAFVVDWEHNGDRYDIDMPSDYDADTMAMYLYPVTNDVVFEDDFTELDPEEEPEDVPDGGDIEFTSELALNVVMAIYRMEADGHFTEIAKDIANTGDATIVDPHPTLGYVKYRVVVTDLINGTMYFEDIASTPVPENSVIIQWDEQWRDFTAEEAISEDRLLEAPVSGSFLKLPYNINVQDSTNIDVSFVNYIGRRHPVSYYGTHIGETATISCEIDATDTQTIFMLRRLASWMGDCYIREPSGLGYWAQVKPSFNLEHCKVTVPVTFNITRVEGGA